MKETSKWAQIRQAVALSLPVGLGLYPLGIALGLLVMQSGLHWWVGPGLSTFGYAGSLEFFAIELFTSKASIVTIALTTLFVNFRHVFYAFSFPLHVVKNPIARLYSMYALTDEAYAITTANPTGWTGLKLVTLQALLQSYWVAGGLTGIFLGSLIPEPIDGLDFALLALFIVLALDAARTKAQVPSVLLAGLAFLIAVFATPESILFTGMIVFALLLGLRFVFSRKTGGLYLG